MKKALKLSYFLLVLVLMVSVLPVTAHADPPDDQCPDYYADLNNGGHHEWVLIHEDPATCTKDGAKYWSCEYCGRDHTDYTPALGHSWSAWTANGAGSEMRTCSRCGDTETRSVAVTTTDPPETPVPDSKVKVTKSPTGESVAAGEDAWFVAHADNSTGTNWYVQSADGGTVYSAADAPSHFPGLSVAGANNDSLHLSNIPVSMSGWTVYASFSGNGGPVYTGAAKITVTPATPSPATAAPATPAQAQATPAPTEEAAVTPEPAPTPTEEPEPSPSPTPEPEENEKKDHTGLFIFGAVAITALICGTVIYLKTLENKRRKRRRSGKTSKQTRYRDEDD